MPEQITDRELSRWLIRSMERLKDYAEQGLRAQLEAGILTQETFEEKSKFISWHDSLVAEVVRRKLLPSVPVTVRTDAGRKVGAF